MRKTPANRHGFLLIFTLLLITGLTTLTTVSMTRSTMDLAAANRFVVQQRVYQDAEAGIDCAIEQLRQRTSLTDAGTACSTAGRTVALSQPTGPGSGANPPITISVDATSGGVTARQVAVVRQTVTSPFQQAAYGFDRVSVTTGGLVDSYKSTLGVYGAALVAPGDPNYGTLNKSQDGLASSLKGNVRTNGFIQIQQASGGGIDSQVKGSAGTPVGAAAVTVGIGGSLSGAMTQTTIDTFVDPIPPDDPGNPASPNYDATCVTLPSDLNVSDSQVYSGTCYRIPGGLTVNSGGQLTFGASNATIYIDGDTTVTGGGKMQFKGTLRTAKLVVNNAGSYVRGSSGVVNIYATKGVIISTDGEVYGFGKTPEKLRLYSTHDSFANGGAGNAVWAVGGKFYGTVYAPKGSVAIEMDWSGVDAAIYGSIIAKDVLMFLEGQLHYDEALNTAAAGWPTWMRATVTVLAQGSNFPTPPPPPPGPDPNPNPDPGA
jgi:Tfp pilus assembly protein PilX